MSGIAISPDGRGRVLLTRLVDVPSEHYLGSVDGDGVITLTPASLRPKMVNDALEVDPELFERLDAQFAAGEPATPSELWERIKEETAE